MSTATTTNTPNLVRLIEDSMHRNQGPRLGLVHELDPDGVHVLSYQMLHNDIEWRCLWLVKLRGTMEPCEILMDNDLGVLEKHITRHRCPCIAGYGTPGEACLRCNRVQ